jgi:hypothetical protein
MIYLAYDERSEFGPMCGAKVSDWPRHGMIPALISAQPGHFALAPTAELLQNGLPFAYVLKWRHYFEFYSYEDAQFQLQHIKKRFSWMIGHPVLSALRRGQAKLVLADWFEGEVQNVSKTLPGGNHFKFQMLAQLLDIPIKSIVFVHGNRHASANETPFSPHYVHENTFELNTYQIFTGLAHNKGIIIEQHPLDKPLRFLSYSRHWNEYRQSLTLELFMRGLDNLGLISCGALHLPEPEQSAPWFAHQLNHWVSDEDERQAMLAALPAFLERLPIQLDFDLSINLINDVTLDHYLTTDLSLVNETYVNARTVFLTEKIFKTMFLKHPFLLMGNPGSLAHLHELGYRTFSPFLDERYDDEPHLPTRKNMLLAELTRFCNLPKEQRLDIRARLDEVTEYNHKHLLGAGDRRTFGANLVRFLTDTFNGSSNAIQQGN